jgi:predicted TIM-barrel fold metal-dependent hydrolase
MNGYIARLLALASIAFALGAHAAPVVPDSAQAATAKVRTPVADHHQHLFSPSIVALIDSPNIREVTSTALIAKMDEAGIRQATVLSTAYMFGRPDRNLPDEYARVRAENDWTAEQAAMYPDRLVAFCGVNPLRSYALEELARCAAHPGLRRGVKLHLGNGDFQIDEPGHLDTLRKFFKAANQYRMAIVVHARASLRHKRPYGAPQARAFIEELLPLAPDVTVQIAHLAGTGPGFEDAPAQEALAVFAQAIERGDPRMKNVWFDVASNAHRSNSPEATALLVKRMRQIGMSRLLYGTDTPTKSHEAWEDFQRLPLTAAELSQITQNKAPYLR